MSTHDLKKGFNNGYMLKAQAPKLADKFTQIFSEILSDKEDEYAQGFIAGVRERESEKPVQKRRNYTIQRSPEKSNSRSKDQDKGFRDR